MLQQPGPLRLNLPGTPIVTADSSALEHRGGREELRAALLRPALLRLRQREGSAAVQQVLHLAGMKESEVLHDSAWIPLSYVRKVLDLLLERLGPEALASQGEFATSPEVLGLHVRLLRQVQTPQEAYEYIAHESREFSRLSTCQLEFLSETQARLCYQPLAELEADQAYPSICLLRQAYLRAIPCLWGLPEAQLSSTSCIAHGDLNCCYSLTWQPLARSRLALFSSLAALFLLGVSATLSTKPLWLALAALLGTLLGAGLNQAYVHLKREAATRTLERHRILALEHGLEQRGQLASQAADLTHSVLGGKYRILRRVGSGGIGTVYAAEHLGLGIQVAVKVLRGAAAVDASEVARLRREARIQMSLEHPNVIRTFDLDQMSDGTLYIVMELLRGRSLQDYLKAHRLLPLDQAIPLFIQACRALSAAHRLGIVHRDLKPGNIFLCEGGGMKVLDFGMSQLADEETLTQDGYTLGTPEYMSPEQCLGHPVDARSDIYAFGVLMYEALTGTLPFVGKTRQILLEHHQRALPRPMRLVQPELPIPEQLDRIVLACLQKRPLERPQTAQQLERLLAALPSAHLLRDPATESPSSWSPSPPSSGRNSS